MKRLFTASLLALSSLGASACVDAGTQSPIRIGNALAFSDPKAEDCGDPEQNRYVPDQTVQLGWFTKGVDVPIYQPFAVASNLQTPTGQGVDPASNDFVASEVEFTYTSPTNPQLTFETERVPYYTVISAGAGEGGFIALDLITPKASARLFDLIGKDAPEQPALLMVTFKLRGRLGGGGQVVESNAVTYPINVYHQSVVCPTGTEPTLDCYDHVYCAAPATTP